MAAVQSVSSTTFSSTSTVVVTKPSGLAVGDLMVAQIVGSSLSTPSGWTLIRSDNIASDPYSTLFYKFADSTDTAASNFSFALSGSSSAAGGILRIDGVSQGRPIWADAGSTNQTDTDSPSFANTITPSIASSIIIIFGSTSQADTGNTVATYALATSSPTFTEAWDTNNSNGTNVSKIMCCAYGTRTQTTATGNSSFVINAGGASNADSIGQIIAVTPTKDFSQLDTVSAVSTSSGSIVSTFLDTITTSDTVTTSKARLWTNLVRNIKTWTNTNR